VFDILGKFIKIEIWDTNVSIINSHLIQTYYKITNGFVMLCEVKNIDSIKFIEKQIEKIIKYSSSNLANIHLFAIFKDDQDFERYNCNIEYLNQNFHQIKPNFIKLNRYDFNCDSGFTKFIHNCLIKKSLIQNGSTILNKNNVPKKQRNSNKQTFLNQNLDHSSQNNILTSQNEAFRDMSASPKKSKNDNCNIF
jgi:hypothetical protein